MVAKAKDDKMFSLTQVITLCTIVASVALSYAGLSSKMEVQNVRIDDHEKRIGKVEENQYADYGRQEAPTKHFYQSNEAIIPQSIQFNRKRR